MFTAANRFGGLNKSTLPTELIPLNSIQLARGLLNFAVIQSSLDWVLPFWAERQYDPSDPAFVPRSHLGLSVNVTHRNWTGIGTPDFPVEPIVDPRGLVTPFPGAWSLDTWVRIGDECFFPSRLPEVRQRLVDNLPIVETTFQAGPVEATLTSFTREDRLYHSVRLTSEQPGGKAVLGLAFRPFNPEGVSLLHEIRLREDRRWGMVGKDSAFLLSRTPDRSVLSGFEQGDSSHAFESGSAPTADREIRCTLGLASGVVMFDLNPSRQGGEVVSCVIASPGRLPSIPDNPLSEAIDRWREWTEGGIEFDLPDVRLSSLVLASRNAMLMFVDGATITPGPATYHQFWFRDAAYMLLALERAGYSRLAKPIVDSFGTYQEPSGYYRSQQGEWDSNGQALWATWQYLLYSGDFSVVESSFSEMERGLRWIEETRLRDRSYESEAAYGLLPAGLSAEHLGLSDFYYWDNFWSVAGMEAFARIAEESGRNVEAGQAWRGAGEYRQDIDRAIRRSSVKTGGDAIPAGPLRRIDSGTIGSCSAWYPLQVYPGNDPRLEATAAALTSRYMRDGMFFQHFIHSGKNAYLSIHIAQVALLAGRREEFWSILTSVAGQATSTYTFPEAIHPSTGGGSMGDGHHGWAAAEIVLAFREAFLREIWTPGDHQHQMVFLSGIPRDWFEGSFPFSVSHAPSPEGNFSVRVIPGPEQVEIRITRESAGLLPQGKNLVRLPFRTEAVTLLDPNAIDVYPNGTETEIVLPEIAVGRTITITFVRS